MRWGLVGLAMVSVATGCGDPILIEPPPTNTGGASHWPLTQGSTWTFRITDPLRGQFQKTVEVKGEGPVPESAHQAIQVSSVQPHLEELSWQVERDGVVYRVREEDRKAGALARVTTWEPATVKAVAAGQKLGWELQATVHELVLGPDGSPIEEGDKQYAWRVVAVDEEVTVPAGTFKALKLQRDRPDKVGKERWYWLVPGVGKVKEDGERLEELERYEVK